MQLHNTELLYGVDSLLEVSSWLSLHAIHRIGILVSKTVMNSKSYHSFLQTLTIYQIAVAHVHCDPTDDEIETIAAIFLQKPLDCIIGIGGGSVLDSAKAIAFMNKETKVFSLKKIKPTQKQRYLVCIPTTTGTGSEISQTVVVKDHKDHKKKRITLEKMKPDLIILEPTLTVSLPAHIVKAGVVDILAHAIESISNQSFLAQHDESIMKYACNAITLVLQSTRGVLQHPKDIRARESLQWAAFYGGLCLRYDLNACHVLSGVLQDFDPSIDHGSAVGMLLYDILEINEPACRSQYAQIECFLRRQEMDEQKLSLLFLKRIRSFLSDVSIIRLEDLCRGDMCNLQHLLYERLPLANQLNPVVIERADIDRILAQHIRNRVNETSDS